MSHVTAHTEDSILRLNTARFVDDNSAILIGLICGTSSLDFAKEIWGKENKKAVHVKFGPSCVCLHYDPNDKTPAVYKYTLENARATKITLTFSPGEIVHFELFLNVENIRKEPEDWTEFTGNKKVQNKLIPYMHDIPALDILGVPEDIIKKLPEGWKSFSITVTAKNSRE